jgi:TPR repeat protein
MLGVSHLLNKNAPQDADEAAKWLRLAADQKYPPAQTALGVIHANGDGVP